MLVDSHCHLDFPEYAGKLDDVVARARDAVGACVSIGTELKRFPGVAPWPSVSTMSGAAWASIRMSGE